jgi:hypothetical protein
MRTLNSRIKAMREIKDCLPHDEAKKHFLDLRNRSLESSIEAHRQDLTLLRASSAHMGTLLSGRQIAQEWKLTENKIDHLAKAYLEDALDTIQLYRIPLTQGVCDCLEQAIQHTIAALYASASNTLGRETAQRSPNNGVAAHLGRAMHQRRFNVLPDIRIRLRESRLAYERREEQRVGESDPKGHTYNIQYNTVQQGGTINASQTGDVHAQILTDNDFEAVAIDLAQVRMELKKLEPSVETDENIGYLAAAERAAREKNEGKMLGYLKMIGSKGWDLIKAVAPQALLLYAKANGVG